MERLCFTFKLAPGALPEYVKRHDEIWPEMLEALTESGYRNYTLFHSDGVITGYAECHPDIATAAAKMGATEVNQRWAAWFEGLIVDLVDEDGSLFTADQVWHHD